MPKGLRETFRLLSAAVATSRQDRRFSERVLAAIAAGAER
jgi:hypothetical protein